MGQTALFSDMSGADLDGPYRYQLWRRWEPQPSVVFVMLNPSTADASEDDPTIRKCIGFAKRWGFGGIVVVNLFAYRATDPAEMVLARRRGVDVVGPKNDQYIREAVEFGQYVVAAWGRLPVAAERGKQVAGIAKDLGKQLLCIETTNSGQPSHPLMLPYCARERLTAWEP